MRMGFQARQAHQEDVFTSLTDTQNELLCRDPLAAAADQSRTTATQHRQGEPPTPLRCRIWPFMIKAALRRRTGAARVALHRSLARTRAVPASRSALRGPRTRARPGCPVRPWPTGPVDIAGCRSGTSVRVFLACHCPVRARRVNAAYGVATRSLRDGLRPLPTELAAESRRVWQLSGNESARVYRASPQRLPSLRAQHRPLPSAPSVVSFPV